MNVTINEQDTNTTQKPWSSLKLNINVIQSGTASSSSASTKRALDTPVMEIGKSRQSTLLDATFTLIVSLDALSTI